MDQMEPRLVDKALEQIDEHCSNGDLPSSLAQPLRVVIAQPGGRIIVEVLAMEELAGSFGHMRVQVPINARPLDVQVARDICQRITYLTEPWQVLEMDLISSDPHLILRSAEPARELEGISFSEAILRNGDDGGLELDIARYVALKGKSRQIAPNILPRNLFKRLVNDVTEVLTVPLKTEE